MSLASTRALQMEPLVTDSDGQPKGILHRVGTYIHLFVVLGLLLPVVIYLGMMSSVGWRIPSFSVNGVFAFVAKPSQDVMLYASPTSKNFFASTGGNYDVLLKPWRDYLADRQRQYKEITDPSQLKNLDAGVLILPSAVALNDEEKADILAFRARGGAVLSTWAAGSRTGRGEWGGWSFLEKMGAKVVGELAPDSDANHLIVNGESPVSHTLPAGRRLFLSRVSESYLRMQGEGIAARFMNWARIPDEDHLDEGAVLYSETTPQAGRSVVFAFAESAWASNPTLAYLLIDDSMKWLQREPTMVRAAWPNGKLAANAIEMDTEQGFPNALNFSSMLESIDYPTTFFVLTSVGKTYPDALKQLARGHEVGYHGDIHIGFKDQPVDMQEQRIKVMMADMASVLGDTHSMVGFRAPTEGYDETTEKLLQRAGLRYHVADPNRTEDRLPKMAKLEGVDAENDLVVLPRTQRDDINLYWEKLPVEQLSSALRAEARLVLENGALGLLSVHTQNFAVDSALYKALPAYLLYLKQRRETMWLASTGQVADWWRQRERFQVETHYSGKRLLLDVSVVGKSPVKGGTLMVMLPQKDLLPSVQATKTWENVKPVIQRIDAYRAVIIFPTLNPGNYAYQITFNPV